MASNALRRDAVSDPTHHNASILLVEDENLVRMFVADAMRDAGYHVVEAVNADQAIEILNSETAIDLVFSDVRMPGTVDGLGLLAFVRDVSPALPVVITSGHLPPGFALADGAAQFLPKPYRVEQALELIERELGRSPQAGH